METTLTRTTFGDRRNETGNSKDIPEIKCFEHNWTPWKVRTDEVGEAWQRQTVTEEYRECTDCDTYQVK